MKKIIIVIGGLAAGPSAAAQAAKFNPHAEVILFEQSETVSYGICEVPYLIGGDIQDENLLEIYSPGRLAEEKGITVKILHRVEKIIAAKKKLVVRDLNSGEIKEYQYDKLIIATGASPKKLHIENEDSRNVFNVRTRNDARNILQYIKTEKPSRAVIIGGGMVGVEMAEALSKRNIGVQIVHNTDLPLDNFENETREQVLEKLKQNKIDFFANTKTEAFIKSNKEKVGYVITSKASLETDMVIISIGVIPNVQLAKTTRLRLGTTGAIAVNNLQETNIDGIYAAGDCCEVANIVTGKPAFIPLASLAARSGKTAGINAAGGRFKFEGSVNAAGLKIFGIEVAKVGINSKEAQKLGYKVISETINSSSKVTFMPGSKKITIILIAEQKSGRILGANVFGEDGALLRANILGIAIQQKMTIDELSKSDLIYFPDISPLYDPILIAANKIKRKYRNY